MAQSEGFKEHLRPWLEVKLNQAFPKVSEFSDDEKFLYAAKASSIMKQVIVEVLMWVDSYEQTFNELEKKRSGKVTNKSFKL